MTRMRFCRMLRRQMVWLEGENVLRREIVRVGVVLFSAGGQHDECKVYLARQFWGWLMHTPGMLSFDLFTDGQRVMSD